MDIFCQRIADKIAENCIGGRAVLVTIDNRRLSLILESHSLIVQQWSSSGAGTVTEKGNEKIDIFIEDIYQELLLLKLFSPYTKCY